MIKKKITIFNLMSAMLVVYIMFTNQCLVTCIILHDFVVNYEDGGRTSQKIPPHEQVLEEGAIVFLILLICSLEYS